MVRHWRQVLVRTVLALVLALSAVPRTSAQAQAPQPGPRPTGAAVAAAAVIDVSLDRIRRQLRETPPSASGGQHSLLKLEYYVQVVGTSPPFDFFKEFNIGRASSVQYGGMTHAEFLRVTAPFWRKW